MAFLDDFANSISGYPAASVTLTFGSLTVQSGTSGSINVNEVWSFKVTVTNNGNLNMKNVTLHLQGLNGVGISAAAAGPFNTTGIVTTAAIASVPAHGSASTVNYYLQAPAGASGGVVDVVDVHVNAWDADLLYIQNNLSGHANPPDTKLAREIFP